jgi:hypothetical protein
MNWRDIEERAITFSHSYADAKDEDRDAKPFWKDLFALYGIDLRTVGAFEERVKIHGHAGTGKIDYLSPGKFLIEHKSRGKDLDIAYLQAMGYFGALKEEVRPRYIVLSDFETIRIYDLEANGKKRSTEFLVKDLSKNVKKLAFLSQEEVVEYGEQVSINVKAVRAIGKLHRAFKESHYPPEQLSQLLTRLVFCFFADDTHIFEHNSLRRYIEEHTNVDGSDIGAHLTTIFQILDTSEDKRQIKTNDTLAALPYVNGGLFKEILPTVFGDREIRTTLIKAMEFDWSGISPAIFGSMFQSIMDEKERHDLGAHYTSEENILKVIGPLFLDELKEELEKAKGEDKLRTLWDKVANITLLDPACGCGNFLVVAYRELRRIEIEIIKQLDKGKKGNISKVEAGQVHLGLEANLATLSKMSVERMYGIELESFPAEVAKLSLWLMDHVMNMELGAYYGKPLKKLPLVEAPHIIQGNALQLDWEETVPKDKLTHILGNPPFLGKKEQDEKQKVDMELIWENQKGAGVLDFVTAWYKKATDYIDGTQITVAFVSTNSITQGEQVGVLWPYLLSRGVKIHFAHRTFRWSNEATGKAAVHCVIIGFGQFDIPHKYIYEYADIKGQGLQIEVKNINPYLVEASDVVVENRTSPLNGGPKMNYGSMPIDKGALILTTEEAENIKNDCLQMSPFIRPYMGGEEFLNGTKRYCLWLADANPSLIRTCSPILSRVESVREFREMSERGATKKLAETPYLFGEIRQPNDKYILIPKVSSQTRSYLPIGIVSSDTIASGSALIVGNADSFTLGVLSSSMHMAWMRTVAGRMKSDYQYSVQIVYNNFPWPEMLTEVQKKSVEEAADIVIDIRTRYPNATLADLYDQNTMPADLLKAHQTLDKAVDNCYSKINFKSEPERLKFLFEIYKKYTDLEEKPIKKKKVVKILTPDAI